MQSAVCHAIIQQIDEGRYKPEELETVIHQMPDAFTILDFVAVFRERFPDLWQQLMDRYGLYGSGTRYSALTYLSNRLSSYSKRKTPGLLEPMPVGWKPEEGRYLRRTTPEERQHFGSPWIAVYHRRERAHCRADTRAPGLELGQHGTERVIGERGDDT